MRRFSILALLLGVLFLAACGDDFPGDSDGSPGPIGTFTEKAAETGTGQDDNK